MQTKQSLRVLVVDDNRDCADSLAALLKFEGHEVYTAYDAINGFALATEVLPHVIFHDIQMPEVDGFTAARALRNDARFQDTMLVAVTGYGSENNVLLTLAAGFDRFIMKPVEYNEVLDALAAEGSQLDEHIQHRTAVPTLNSVASSRHSPRLL